MHAKRIWFIILSLLICFCRIEMRVKCVDGAYKTRWLIFLFKEMAATQTVNSQYMIRIYNKEPHTVPELHKIRRSTDFEASKLGKGSLSLGTPNSTGVGHFTQNQSYSSSSTNARGQRTRSIFIDYVTLPNISQLQSPTIRVLSFLN